MGFNPLKSVKKAAKKATKTVSKAVKGATKSATKVAGKEAVKFVKDAGKNLKTVDSVLNNPMLQAGVTVINPGAGAAMAAAGRATSMARSLTKSPKVKQVTDLAGEVGGIVSQGNPGRIVDYSVPPGNPIYDAPSVDPYEPVAFGPQIGIFPQESGINQGGGYINSGVQSRSFLGGGAVFDQYNKITNGMKKPAWYREVR